MAKNSKKQNALGSIASIQTILERYPVLITNDEVGNTSLSFTFDLLEILGLSSDDIIHLLSKLLSDKDGWLDALEWTIKGILISTFKDTYTCSINPRLPTDTMYSVYADEPLDDRGIKINLDDIDVFGILNNCPTTEKGSTFYFDTSSEYGYTPTNVYSSTDFNAYLWYVINKGQNPPRYKSVWDNRVDYRNKFDLRGDFSVASKKGKFLNTECGQLTPIKKVDGVGPKKEILSCSFVEGGGMRSNYLNVLINYDRYYGVFGPKTIFEFNFDYIMSLKLFDSTTLVTQIVNAIVGISSNANVNMSLNKQIIAAKVREIVNNVIESEDASPEDCYFTFSNEEYNKLINEAMQKYNGEYTLNGTTVNVNEDEIFAEVKKINSASADEKADAIKEVFKTVSKTVSTYEYESEGSVSIEFDIIRKFLEETVLQIALQILSPKVMILYAINEKVLNPEGQGTLGIVEFFKKFINLMVSLTKQIFNLIMEYIAEYLMGELKLILYLFVEKILLEKVAYYMMLIEQLITTCTAGIGNLSLSFTGRRNNPLTIEDVRGADIIPVQESPIVNEC